MASTSDRAYVWAWLPGQSQPVPVGALDRRGGTIAFAYGTRYLQRPDAISLWDRELPLHAGWQEPLDGRQVASCLRDAAPDHWGRRVILDRLVGRQALHDGVELDELTYLREASSDRIGALDVQDSAAEYLPRDQAASLDEIEEAAHLLDEGAQIPEALRLALASGTGVGGARPKALLRIGDQQYVAKFSTTSDDPSAPAVSAEAVSIELARRVGVPVPASRLVDVRGRRVLFTERFDRTPDGNRRMVLSGHTLTAATESFLDRGSYVELFDVLRRRSSRPEGLGEQVFRRIAFNMAITNTDDHLRNHSAFWDGKHADLTPAYDLSPGSRSGDTASLAMGYDAAGSREVRFASLVRACSVYGLSGERARQIVDEMVATIIDTWPEACETARLTHAERSAMWGRQFLHESTRYDYAPARIRVGPRPRTSRGPRGITSGPDR